MATLLILTCFAAIPTLAFLATKYCPRTVQFLSLGSIGIGLLFFGLLFGISEIMPELRGNAIIANGLVLNPYLCVFSGICSLFLGMGGYLGFGLRKIAQNYRLK